MSTDKKEEAAKPKTRELKPGRVLDLGGRKYKGRSVKEKKDDQIKEKKGIAVKRTCMVPETLIKDHKIRDWHFVGAPDKPKAEPDKSKT